MNPRSLREAAGDALRYWEPRRIAYNILLTAVVIGWIVTAWPPFRNAVTLPAIRIMHVLALLANLCYCGAYLVDIALLRSSLTARWLRCRPLLWLAGTLFATVLATYWIGDEIYPFVN